MKKIMKSWRRFLNEGTEQSGGILKEDWPGEMFSSQPNPAVPQSIGGGIENRERREIPEHFTKITFGNLYNLIDVYGYDLTQWNTDNFCTHFPDACRGNLGLRREQMPQVKKVPEFENELDDPAGEGPETNEPEKIPDHDSATPEYLNSSNQSGWWPVGDQVDLVEKSGVDPMDIKPTQVDIYMGNALDKVHSAEGGKWFPWDDSVLISNDGHLIDGHHRWAATIIYNSHNPDDYQTMNVREVQMPIEDSLRVANAFTGAKGWAQASGGETVAESIIREMIREEIKNL